MLFKEALRCCDRDQQQQQQQHQQLQMHASQLLNYSRSFCEICENFEFCFRFDQKF